MKGECNLEKMGVRPNSHASKIVSGRKLADQFCSHLHVAHMKARGFKKNGRNFDLACNGYGIRISIQGSTWNSGDEPWHFYVNLSIRLNDVPPVTDENIVFQASGRLEGLVPSAPEAFDLAASHLESLVRELVMYIDEAIVAVPDKLPPVRARALKGFWSPFPVPDTWLNEQAA